MRAFAVEDPEHDEMDYTANQGYEDAPATQLLATHCLLCARPLVDANSVERGIGPECYEKSVLAAMAAGQKLPTDHAAVDKALSTAPEALREALAPHMGDSTKMANVATARAAFAIKVGAKDAEQLIGAAIELTGALGFATLSDRIKQRFVVEERTGSGIRVQKVGGGRMAVFTPYDGTFVTLMRNVPGRRFDRTPAPHNSFPESEWLKVLNALVARWPGKLALDWEGQLLLIPTEPLPLPGPETPPAGPPTEANDATPPRPAERIEKGMTVVDVNGKEYQVGWVSPDGLRIGIRKGSYGRMDAFLGVNEVKLIAAKPAEVKAVSEELATQQQPARPKVTRKLPEKLFPYQREGAIWLDTVGSGILAYDMGLGKSAVSIAVCDSPAVVVCPASLRVNWVREFNMWHPDLKVATVGVAVKDGKTVKGETRITPEQLAADVVVINYDILKGDNLQALLTRPLSTLICDEVHYVKELALKFNRESGKYEPSGKGSQRAGNVWRLAQHAKRKLLLTGTPIKNYVYEIWPLLNMVAPGEFKNKHNFCVQYCGAQKTRFGWDYRGRSNSDELNKLISGRYMLRRTKDELKALGMLPDKARFTKELALSGQAAKDYERAAREFLDWVLERGGPEAVMKASKAEALTKLTALRRLAAIGKAEGFIEECMEHHDSTKRPLIVFGWHREALESVIAGLREQGLKVGQILGGDSASERQQAIDAFQQGEPSSAPVEERTYLDVIVCSIQAAGVGLTLTRARETFFLERAWSPADLVQAEDRSYRIGQKNDVAITYYDAAGTIDGYMADLLVAKTSTFAAVVDGKPLDEEEALTTVMGKLFSAAEKAGMRPNARGGPVDYDPTLFDWANPSML